MCGIVGKINFNSGHSSIERETINDMLSVIEHRGPDGRGIWISENKNVGLGHNRLSIIDLSENANQPMISESGRYSMVFNGEIYNYLELKSSLEQSGSKFKSSSDSEVLLRLFELKQEKCLNDLDGMFAFAIWDNLENKLFCARDRFGEKPFFFNLSKDSFVFGSEIKGVLKSGINSKISNERIFKYLIHDSIDDADDISSTFFENVKQLKPSHYLWLNSDGRLDERRYWSITTESGNLPSEEEAKEKFIDLLQKSVMRRLRSDVPVGSSLSGGLDSSTIVYLINKLKVDGQKQSTFSARFNDFDKDEGKHIEEILKVVNANANMVWVEESDFISDLDRVFFHQEQPFQSSSIIAQWKVMELARKNNTVVLLDGQGADEILAGYHNYFNSFLYEMYSNSSKEYKKQLFEFNSMHGKNYSLNPLLKLKAKLGLKGGEYESKIGKESALQISNSFSSDFSSVMYSSKTVFHSSLSENLKFSIEKAGLSQLLRYSDRNSMAHSIEVRLPYLDHNLVNFMFSLPASYKIKNGWTKYIQRAAFNNKLPNSITWRKDKIGYITPQAKWLNNEKIKAIYNDCNRVLVENNILKAGKHIDVWKTIMVAKLISFRSTF